MSKSTAWDKEGVSAAARRLAEQAAGRAGVPLEEWLDRAIAEQASFGELTKLFEASAREGAAQLAKDVQTSRATARDLQERLRATAGPASRPRTQGEESDGRGFESVDPPPARANPASSIGAPASLTSPAKPTAPVGAPESPGHFPLNRGPQPALPPMGDRPADPSAFDLQSAVSQIASRRRALDAHQAHDGLEPPRNLERSRVDDARTQARSPLGLGGSGSTLPTSSDGLRLDLRTLSGKLDALRREWSETRASDRDLASLQDQVTAVRHSLSDLAPLEAVSALEGSLNELTQRVSALNLDELGGPLLAPLDAVAAELRETLGGYDPKLAAAELERQVDSLRVRIDALADASVRPEVFEALRRRMEEVHDLLLTAARRAIPIERLESQIVGLADQVERLTADVSAGLQTERITEFLAKLRPQTAADPSALAAIERRLDGISSRLDRETVAPDRRDAPELDSRIDAALQHWQGAAQRVEASLDALHSKLEAEGGGSLAAEVRKLSAKLDAVDSRDRERSQSEPVLSDLLERLDRIPVEISKRESIALASLDRELKSIRTAVERGAAAGLGSQAVDRMADDVARRLEARLDGHSATAATYEQIADLAGRLDALAGPLGDAGALGRAARDLLEKLQDGDRRLESLPQASSEFAEQVAALRQERAVADRRTEAVLQSVQNVLDKLVDRLPDDDSQESQDARSREAGDARVLSVGADPAARLANLGDNSSRASANRLDPEGRDESESSHDPDDELLLEPGAGAPRRLQAGADPGRTPGSRTNPAVSAHIAAARRAAQSALAENNDDPPAAWPRVERNVQRARRFFARNKRSLLILAALVLAATAAVRLMEAHPSLLQRSDAGGHPAKVAAAQDLPGPLAGFVAAPVSVDPAPTGSIGRPQARLDSSPASAPTIPDGVPPSLRDAVLAGSAAAEFELAQRLSEGRGMNPDQAASAFWLEQAASKGFARAAFRLGASYQKGVGVQRDPAAAKRWYTAAAQSGNARAAHNLGVMDAEPSDNKADYADAAKWFRRAAEMGVRDSQFNLAVLYARGLGVEQDLRQSWMWFSLAAAQGDPEAARKRDEVAAKMNPGALAAAADQLSKFKVVEPDPAANDDDASNWGDRPAPPAATPASQSGP